MQSFATSKPRKSGSRQRWGATIVLAIVMGSARPVAGGVNAWTSAGPRGIVVTALAADANMPGYVYAGSAGHGVFRSIDGGGTWQNVSVGLGDTYIDAVVVDPHAPGTLYATSPNRGVFKSSDAGQTWTAASAGLPDTSAHLLAIDERSGELYVSTGDGVFCSEDGGDSWEPTALRTRMDPPPGGSIALGAWIDCLAVDPSTGAVYACFFDWSATDGMSWQLLRSDDRGGRWQPVPIGRGQGPLAIAIDAATPALSVITFDPGSGAYGVLGSSDGGDDWEAVGDGMPGCEAPCRIHALSVDPAVPGTLYAGTDRGVFIFDASDRGWHPLGTGMEDMAVTEVVVDPADPTRAYAATSHGVFAIRQASACSGDCDGDGRVTIAELVAAVEVTLGRQSAESCGAADVDGDGRVAIGDLVAGVDRALYGCE